MSLRRVPGCCKDKDMQYESPNACASASPSRVPEIIFANWREMLNQLKLARAGCPRYWHSGNAS